MKSCNETISWNQQILTWLSDNWPDCRAASACCTDSGDGLLLLLLLILLLLLDEDPIPLPGELEVPFIWRWDTWNTKGAISDVWRVRKTTRGLEIWIRAIKINKYVDTWIKTSWISGNGVESGSGKYLDGYVDMKVLIYKGGPKRTFPKLITKNDAICPSFLISTEKCLPFADDFRLSGLSLFWAKLY